MPTLQVNGAQLYYEDRGSGAETILFAHGLLFDHCLFEAQVAAFQDRNLCVTFDFRGQGQSEVTPGGYDMDTLAEDAAALMDALALWPCHFVGVSMGGFVGLRLALHYPEMLHSLSLLDTSADPGAGHMSVVEQPGRINSELDAFLSGLSSRHERTGF